MNDNATRPINKTYHLFHVDFVCVPCVAHSIIYKPHFHGGVVMGMTAAILTILTSNVTQQRHIDANKSERCSNDCVWTVTENLSQAHDICRFYWMYTVHNSLAMVIPSTVVSFIPHNTIWFFTSVRFVKIFLDLCIWAQQQYRQCVCVLHQNLFIDTIIKIVINFDQFSHLFRYEWFYLFDWWLCFAFQFRLEIF